MSKAEKSYTDPLSETREVAIAKRNGEIAAIQPSMESILLRAVDSGASIEMLERIAAMVEKSQAQAAKREYLAALSRFQEAMPMIKKQKRVNNKDGTKRFTYAPTEDIMPIARPFLAENQLSVTTGSRVDDNKLIATCFVHHSGGHTEARDFVVPIEPSQFMSAPQSYAAASTFAERYATRQALGIVTAGDDNEQRLTPSEARKTVSQPKATPTAQKAAGKANGGSGRVQLEPAGEGEAIDAATIKGLSAAMEHANMGQSDFVARFPNLSGLEQVKKADARVVMSWLGDPNKN